MTNAHEIVALTTLQFANGGLMDATPVDNWRVHLVRTTSRGTPGGTLCGIDRTDPDGPGWSVGGGMQGPDIEHKPCPGCAVVARDEFPELPIHGLGARQMCEALGRSAP